MRRRLANDDGIAIIVAMLVLLVMMSLGLAIIALADSQQGPARDERLRVSSGTLAEAALTNQVFQLSRMTWPTTAQPPTVLAGNCDANAATADSCPDPGTLAATFNATASNDYTPCAGQPAWRTWIRDNGPIESGTPTNPARSYYTKAADGPASTLYPAYDANRDGAMWVGAEGYSRGCKLRRFVTLVKANTTSVPVPGNVITANWMQVLGKKKSMVDTTGQHANPKTLRPPKKQAATQAAPVVLHCNGTWSAPPAGAFDACTGTLPKDSIKPNSLTKPPTIAAGLPQPLFSAQQIGGFAQLAAADPTGNKDYPPGTCPTNLTGAIVVIEDISTVNCSVNVDGNTKNTPGFLVIKKGTLTLAGKAVYSGFIYHANQTYPGATNKQLFLTGSSVVQGPVYIDGAGGLYIGTKHSGVIFDRRGWAQVKVPTNAIAVPGTWRELGPNE